MNEFSILKHQVIFVSMVFAVFCWGLYWAQLVFHGKLCFQEQIGQDLQRRIDTLEVGLRGTAENLPVIPLGKCIAGVKKDI